MEIDSCCQTIKMKTIEIYSVTKILQRISQKFCTTFVRTLLNYLKLKYKSVH